MDKTSNNCGLLNHFAKVCRKQKTQKPQNPKKTSVNNVDEEPHPEDSVNFLQSSLKLYEYDYRRGDDNMVTTIPNDLAKKPRNMPIKTGSIFTTPLVNSGSACSIINQSLGPELSTAVRMRSGYANPINHNCGPYQTNRFKLSVRSKHQ